MKKKQNKVINLFDFIGENFATNKQKLKNALYQKNGVYFLEEELRIFFGEIGNYKKDESIPVTTWPIQKAIDLVKIFNKFNSSETALKIELFLRNERKNSALKKRLETLLLSIEEIEEMKSPKFELRFYKKKAELYTVKNDNAIENHSDLVRKASYEAYCFLEKWTILLEKIERVRKCLDTKIVSKKNIFIQKAG